MALRDRPIRQRLMAMLLVTSGAVLALTCAAFLAYEFITFRQTTLDHLSTMGRVIAANSTASLAFRNDADAREILSALRAEPHIVAAALYGKDGRLFARYPADLPRQAIPPTAEADGYRFERSALVGWEPVAEPGSARLGTLYLQSDLKEMYGTFALAGITALLVIGLSLVVAYVLSNLLQGAISRPILALAETAASVSELHDYSVRAPKLSEDELGRLTDAFNHMLSRIEDQDRALRAALQARDVFLGVASHELRTPLTSLHLEVTNLRRTLTAVPAPPAVQQRMMRQFEVLERQTERLTQLVESLLDVSRAMAGRFELIFENFDLSEAVEDLVVRLRGQAARAGCTLLADVQSPCAGRWDRIRTEQILTNLLVNAVKFGAGKPVRLALVCSPETVVLTVQDQGIGIRKEDHERIFERFEQASSPRPFGGLGLGLWIVRQIVSAMGGSVEVRSELGRGAEFIVIIPRVPNAEMQRPAVASANQEGALP